MYKILLTTFFIFLFLFNSFSQKGYYANDTLKAVGVDIADRGSILNSKICQIKNKDTITEFSPYEIIEYGISEDLIYVAKDIFINDTLKRVFLEVLLKGKTTLYYYRNENYGTFYISKDSVTLIEVPEKGNNEKQYYKSVLRDITSDCMEVSEAINLVKYNRKTVTELINRYNNCEDKPFPFFKFGVLGGYELSSLANPSQATPAFLEYLDYQSNRFLTIGLFVDLPIMPTNLSVHIELYHSSHKFSETGIKNNEYYDLTANQNSIKIPILLRYTLNRGKTNPFVNAGGIFGFNYRNENAIYVTNSNNNNINIEKLDNTSAISQFQYGFSAGWGIEQKINYKDALFFELRFNKLFGLSKNTLGNNEIQLITGINF
ncbi:MAG: PorT family protein [Prolixibacteraceae bacterium]|nr:PorT family protein [Prolixibacteraceae bacterium]